jgi:hypothetical protein
VLHRETGLAGPALSISVLYLKLDLTGAVRRATVVTASGVSELWGYRIGLELLAGYSVRGDVELRLPLLLPSSTLRRMLADEKRLELASGECFWTRLRGRTPILREGDGELLAETTL